MNKKQPWPPVWTKSPKKLTKDYIKKMMYVLIALGRKKLANTDLQSMFSTDVFLREEWLHQVTSLREFKHFLRTMHFEDNMDPTGKNGGTNFRPNGVPKVGLLMELLRRECENFFPDGPQDYDYDEHTSEYNGLRSTMKHKMRAKPHDGFLIYMVNHAPSFYVKNFMMDIRNKKCTLEKMFRDVVGPALGGSGVNLFADNAFVSVLQCRWARDNQINFSGTTRTSYGFPKELIEGPHAPTTKGDWAFAMSPDGLLATSWIGLYYLFACLHLECACG